MKTGTYSGRAASDTLRDLAAIGATAVDRVGQVLSETRASVREWLRLRGYTDVSLAQVEDWELACAARVNVWLRGPQHTTRAALTTLGPVLSEPVVTLRAGAPLVLVPRSIATLIVEDVSALALDDQQRLLAWLDDVAEGTRVISVTSAPILPLLESGAFLGALYYRLNTVYVDLIREPKQVH